MGYLFRMAGRNLWRNKRRSTLAFLSVALSVLLCVFMQGFTGGYLASLVKNYTKSDTGHVRITTRGFVERAGFLPIDELVRNPASIEAKIAADPVVGPRISVMTERATFGVLLVGGGRNRAAVAMAGDPGTERTLLGLARSVQPGGRYLGGPGEMIVGAKLAESLGVSVGDALEVAARASDGSFARAKLAIVGLFSSGIGTLDDRAIQMSIGDAKTLLRSSGGAQQIIIMLRDYRDAPDTAARIAALVGDPSVAVLPWSSIGSYGALIELMSTMLGYLLVVVLFLGAFIITNIMTMVVLERRREIGILKSMGLSNGETLVLFVWEGILLGVWGSVIGAAAGLGLNVLFHFRGLDVSAALASANMPLDNVIYWTVDVPFAALVVVIAAVVSGIVSVLPSVRAARMNAVQAIRSV